MLRLQGAKHVSSYKLWEISVADIKQNLYPNTVVAQLSNASLFEQFGSRTKHLTKNWLCYYVMSNFCRKFDQNWADSKIWNWIVSLNLPFCPLQRGLCQPPSLPLPVEALLLLRGTLWSSWGTSHSSSRWDRSSSKTRLFYRPCCSSSAETTHSCCRYRTSTTHSVQVKQLLRVTPCLLLQQITQHQEQFVQMLNEPRPGDTGGDTGGEGAEAEAQGSPQTNYIQVTPQEKEAIERVRVFLSSVQ